jgi:hypothetical protein
MKKIRVITCQIIHQEWEYEVEVEDNFELKRIPTLDQSRYLLDKIYNEGIEGHCLDNDEVVEEILADYEEMGA